MRNKNFDNDSALKVIAQQGLLSVIEQGFPLITGLKAIEAIESIVASGTVDIDGPMSVQFIETRDELTQALADCADRSLDALRAAGHDDPGIYNRAVLEDEWYNDGEKNRADGDYIRSLSVICSAASLMHSVIQSHVTA